MRHKQQNKWKKNVHKEHAKTKDDKKKNVHLYGKKHHSMSKRNERKKKKSRLQIIHMNRTINIRLNILLFCFAVVILGGVVRPCKVTKYEPIKTWYELVSEIVINCFECKTIDS